MSLRFSQERREVTMSNNKQSSVEFLWDELKPFLPANYTVDESVKILSILKQAKAMHKEEVTDAYHDGKTNGMDISHHLSLTEEISATEWYNETFGE